MGTVTCFQAFPSWTPTRFRRNAIENFRRPLYVRTSRCCSENLEPRTRRSFMSEVFNIGTAATIASLSKSAEAADTVELDVVEESTAASASPSSDQKNRKLVWGYVDEIGPEHWGSLSEDWKLCDTGKNQSPIALSYKSAGIGGVGALADYVRPTISTSKQKFVLKKREVLPFAATKSLVVEPFIPPPPAIVGDAPPVDIPVKPPSPAVLSVPDVGVYTFRNLHIHAGGSEHVIDGFRASMEVHLVFSEKVPPKLERSDSESSDDSSSVTEAPSTSRPRSSVGSSIAVVGVLVSEGETTTPWLSSLISYACKPETDAISTTGKLVEIDISEVIPDFNHASLYTYDGSLTTPPGTEGIHWIVLTERASVTKADAQLLESFQGGANVRPLQPLGNREVIRFPREES